MARSVQCESFCCSSTSALLEPGFSLTLWPHGWPQCMPRDKNHFGCDGTSIRENSEQNSVAFAQLPIHCAPSLSFAGVDKLI